MKWDSEENEILLNPRWPAADLDFLRTGAEKILEEKSLKEHFVLSSSGTTAASWRAVKLIFISKKAVLAAAQSVVQQFSLSSKDRLGQTLPEFHVGGLGVLARTFLSGASLVSDFESATVLSLVPTQLFDLLKQETRPPRELRWVFMGGGFLATELEQKARASGWPLVLTYGMTETSAMIAARTEADPTQGLRPFPNVEGAPGREGRWKFRAPGLATGSALITSDGFLWHDIKDSDGWFQSEDRLQVLNGRWLIEGRTSDFLKIGGESVNLSVLRKIFSQVDGGESAYLTSRVSARLGHEIVLATEGGNFETVVDQYNAKVLPFERIRAIIEVGTLPRTELGKIREEELKRRILETKGPE